MVEIGGIWFLKGIGVLDFWEIFFFNIFIFFLFGVVVIWVYYVIFVGKEK